MASLREISRTFADEICDGIAWVVIWKIGRSWHAESFWLNADDDTFEPYDLNSAYDILKEDANAVMVNGYYCGHFGEEMSIAEIVDGIKWHYENNYNLLGNSNAFPPEPKERPESLPSDIPWYGKETNMGADPYVYDGYMSMEDYELMRNEEQAEERQKEKFEGQRISADLLESQWSALICYLLMSTNYRERERNAWKELSQERADDGVTPKYKHAASNTAFWDEMIKSLDEIMEKIDDRGG